MIEVLAVDPSALIRGADEEDIRIEMIVSISRLLDNTRAELSALSEFLEE